MSNLTTTVRSLDELKPVAKLACQTFLKECEKAGIDIFITETYRSQQRQNYLYEQGRTRPGNKVTWTRNSRHTSRLAWDIACNKPSLYDVATIKKAGAIAKKLEITWGGDWTTPDMPHFEVKAKWKLPDGYNEKEETKGSEIKMYSPSNNTLKNEFIKFLESANKEGILTSKEWIIKAKEGRLSESDAISLTALYILRTKGE